MAEKKGKKGNERSIRQQIGKLLMIVFLTMILIVIALIGMLVSVNSRYEGALRCANTAAEFNNEFKSNLDLEMYNHVIRPRTADPAQELPMQELEQAEDVIARLEHDTSLPDNRWRARSMLDMCRNLRMYMLEIASTDSYDKRMELLERNISGETGLTLLIETYMHDFVDDEVRELSRLRNEISLQSTWLVAVSAVVIGVLTALILLYSLRVSRSITEPISAMSVKAQRFGEDDYTNAPVRTDILELQTLDRSFDRMAERIQSLMKKQIEDQQSLHRAELELLFAQINPHFLYNTLDSIVILAESEREEEVVAMVTALSTFFRNSLSDGRDVIPLRAELSQATSYLEIQQIRYSDIMDYEIHVSEEIMDCMVPKLILQPLIENALYHGIKNRRGRGTIAIFGEKEGQDLILTVKDNGAGMAEQKLAQLRNGEEQTSRGGLGLKNVSQRIRLYCGDAYGLSFMSSPGEGTAVMIRLPGDSIPESEKAASTDVR